MDIFELANSGCINTKEEIIFMRKFVAVAAPRVNQSSVTKWYSAYVNIATNEIISYRIYKEMRTPDNKTFLKCVENSHGATGHEMTISEGKRNYNIQPLRWKNMPSTLSMAGAIIKGK